MPARFNPVRQIGYLWFGMFCFPRNKTIRPVYTKKALSREGRTPLSENIVYTISPLCQFFFLCNAFLILLFVSDGFFLTKGVLLDYDKK